MLHGEIKKSLQEAMKEKNEVKRDTLRQVITELTNALVAKKMKPTEFLDDNEVLVVIKKLVKQRKESIEIYEKAGYTDQATAETEEKAVLESYLPEELSDDELEKIVSTALEGVEDKSNMGMVMKSVMSTVSGRADGSRVSAIVKAKLN